MFELLAMLLSDTKEEIATSPGNELVLSNWTASDEVMGRNFLLLFKALGRSPVVEID